MGVPRPRCMLLLVELVLVLTLGSEKAAEGCSCHPAHPQQHFCYSDIVILAKVSGQKIVSPSNSSSPYMKMVQYEIKLIKMFKGFDKVKDIQYVYTPINSALCGIKLDSNNKIYYLMSGHIRRGRVSIGLCGFTEPWDNLSLTQKKNLNYRYQMGCECKIAPCYSVPCSSTNDDECLWTDWVLDNGLSGEQARQHACIKRSDGSCGWYQSGSPPEKDLLDLSDP